MDTSLTNLIEKLNAAGKMGLDPICVTAASALQRLADANAALEARLRNDVSVLHRADISVMMVLGSGVSIVTLTGTGEGAAIIHLWATRLIKEADSTARS
jgi:hypothetical protein